MDIICNEYDIPKAFGWRWADIEEVNAALDRLKESVVD